MASRRAQGNQEFVSERFFQIGATRMTTFNALSNNTQKIYSGGTPFVADLLCFIVNKPVVTHLDVKLASGLN